MNSENPPDEPANNSIDGNSPETPLGNPTDNPAGNPPVAGNPSSSDSSHNDESMLDEDSSSSSTPTAKFPLGEMSKTPAIPDLVWLSGRSALAKYVARPIRRFIEVEATSGMVLILATVAALIWINSPFGDSYTHFWETEIDIKVGGTEIFTHSLGHFVNDILMVLFFLVVGVEIKSELAVGHLKSFRSAALPAIAAIGGMAVPALIYVALNSGTDNLDGWAIPMATDIAFALGVVSLLGKRIPRNLRVFLLSLAIADDIVAILIIALFYTDQLEFKWLIGALIVFLIMAVARHARIWYFPLYILLGCVLWWMTYRSGVHATIAGVAIGLLTPARALQPLKEARNVAKWIQDKPHVYVADVRWANFYISESVSVADRVKTYLHPFTSYVIVPIFALANGGIEISTEIISGALNSEVTLGVFLGLLLGKLVGVTLFTWIAIKLKIAAMPAGMNWRSIMGAGALAGIGFTVAIFVSSLAFGGDGDKEPLAQLSEAKLGIFAASIVAALMGAYILHKGHKHPSGEMSASEEQS